MGIDKRRIKNLIVEHTKEWYKGLRFGTSFLMQDLELRLNINVDVKLYIVLRSRTFVNNNEVIRYWIMHRAETGIPDLDNDPIHGIHLATLEVFPNIMVKDKFSGYKNHSCIPVMYYEGTFIGNKIIITEDSREFMKDTSIKTAKLTGKAIKETAKGTGKGISMLYNYLKKK